MGARAMAYEAGYDDSASMALANSSMPNFRPHRGEEFEVDQQYDQYGDGQEAQYQLNSQVQEFIKYFYRHVRERNMYDIQDIYDTTWHKLTDKFFKGEAWPPADAIAPLVDNDTVFLYLYKELYYRHIYAKLKPSLEDRVASWENYCNLLDLVLDSEVQLEERLSLPSSWLWDMID